MPQKKIVFLFFTWRQGKCPHQKNRQDRRSTATLFLERQNSKHLTWVAADVPPIREKGKWTLPNGRSCLTVDSGQPSKWTRGVGTLLPVLSVVSERYSPKFIAYNLVVILQKKKFVPKFGAYGVVCTFKIHECETRMWYSDSCKKSVFFAKWHPHDHTLWIVAFDCAFRQSAEKAGKEDRNIEPWHSNSRFGVWSCWFGVDT